MTKSRHLMISKTGKNYKEKKRVLIDVIKSTFQLLNFSCEVKKKWEEKEENQKALTLAT